MTHHLALPGRAPTPTNTQVHTREVRPTQPLVAPSPSPGLIPSPPAATPGQAGQGEEQGRRKGYPETGSSGIPQPWQENRGAKAAGEGTEARQGGLLIVREILFLTDAKADGTELTENGRGKKRKNITGSRESGH